MPESIKKLGKVFANLTPFKIGILTTLIFSLFVSVQYYNLTPQDSPRILERIHHVLSDFKMQTKGPTSPNNSIVLLVIDSEATDNIGKWPWSRSRMADIVERLMAYGANIIGFDILFSGSENAEALKYLEYLRGQTSDTESLGLINRAIRKLNTDIQFSRAIERHSESLIMAGAWKESSSQLYPYQEICQQTITLNDPNYLVLENDQRHLVSVDNYPINPPEFLYSLFEQELTQIEDSIKERYSSENRWSRRNKTQRAILKSQEEFCSQWLTSNSDPLIQILKDTWGSIQESDSSLKEISPNKFIDDFKNSVPKNLVPYTGNWVVNTGIISQGTKFSAFFNIPKDSDGITRKVPLVVRWGELFLPSLALKTAMLKEQLGSSVVMEQHTITGNKFISTLSLTNLDTGENTTPIPTDSRGNLYINFSGPSYTYPHMRASELFNESDKSEITKLLNGRIEQMSISKSRYIRDKTFLIGLRDSKNYIQTPFDKKFLKLEAHANIIGNILDKNFLTHNVTLEAPWMLAALLLIGITFSCFLSQIRIFYGFLLSLFLASVIYLLDFFLLYKNGTLVNVSLPILLVFFVFLILTWFRKSNEVHEKKHNQKNGLNLKDPLSLKTSDPTPKQSNLSNRTNSSEKLVL